MGSVVEAPRVARKGTDGAGWAEWRPGICKGAEKVAGLTLFLHRTDPSDNVMEVQSNSAMNAEDGIHGAGFEVMYKYSHL